MLAGRFQDSPVTSLESFTDASDYFRWLDGLSGSIFLVAGREFALEDLTVAEDGYF